MNEKIQINIYKGLPMVLEKVKLVALAAVVGRTPTWLFQKMNRTQTSTKPSEFREADIPLVNSALQTLGDEIAANLIEFSPDRDAVIAQIKTLGGLVSIPYIYTEHLRVKKSWFTNRMKTVSPGARVSSFKEDDILRINMVAMAIANELKSIEFTL